MSFDKILCFFYLAFQWYNLQVGGICNLEVRVFLFYIENCEKCEKCQNFAIFMKKSNFSDAPPRGVFHINFKTKAIFCPQMSQIIHFWGSNNKNPYFTYQHPPLPLILKLKAGILKIIRPKACIPNSIF